MFKNISLIAGFMILFMSIASAKESEFSSELNKNNEKIRELYQSEGRVNEEIEFLENQLLVIANEIGSKQKIIDEYTSFINQHETKIHNLNQTISILNEEVSDIENSISENLYNINRLQDEVDRFKDVISKRVRNLYMHMDTYNPILRIFYTSENVVDFSERMDNISRFIDIDKSVMEKFLKNIEDIKLINSGVESLKKNMESKIESINEKIKENDDNLTQLEIKKQLKQKEVDEINELNAELRSRYESLSDEKRLIQQELIKIHQDNYKIQEELKKYLENLNKDNTSINSKVNYGKYLKPAQGKITSRYGERLHPITGEKSFHTGIDIGGSTGDNVVASLGGKVVSSGWYNSVYGNVVIINHGNNIQTFYAHLDKTVVEVGQEVIAGSIIGKMGSTGLSTGAHLHFEIRINGEHVDPLKRIKN